MGDGTSVLPAGATVPEAAQRAWEAIEGYVAVLSHLYTIAEVMVIRTRIP
ncbi:MAG: hypothetical protein QOG89_1994, partial [Thermomicrobiales bacterium]|nr:hypothetical protein [Thermomicrobiales bacterium]